MKKGVWGMAKVWSMGKVILKPLLAKDFGDLSLNPLPIQGLREMYCIFLYPDLFFILFHK